MPDWKRPGTGVLGGLLGLVGLSAVAGLLVTTAVTPAIAVTGAATSNAITMFDNLPTTLDIQPLMQPTTLYAKDANTGQYTELAKFYDQNRSVVTYDQIAPVMYDALLSSEDPRYYQHGGIDMLGTARAILSNIKGGADTQGGSSISQQYVKNVLVQQCYATVDSKEFKGDDKKGVSAADQKAAALNKCYTDATSSTGASGIARKLQEMRYAIALEQKYSKKDILLGYLNIANFGGTTYGVDAAAQRYFGVSAKDLNLSQAATLAGMVKNPNTYRLDRPGGTYTVKGVAHNSEKDGYADTKLREDYVLGRMKHDGKITTAQYDEARKAPIVPHITTPNVGCDAAGNAAYFCEYVVSVIRTDKAFGADDNARKNALSQGGLKIYTTLDWRLQNAAKASLTKYTPAASGNDTWKFGAAITNIENSTGRVLSMAQNTNFSNDPNGTADQTAINYSADNAYGGSSGFAPGSTFKLFTLLDWLQKGHSLLDSVNGSNRSIPMVPNSCPGQGGKWLLGSDKMPGNYNREVGYVGTPLKFTSDSLNTGFYAMAEKLDLCDIANEAVTLGVTNANGSPITASPSGRPMVLNSVIGNTQAVSPLTLGNAYAAVANGGTLCKPLVIDKVTDSQGKDRPAPAADCKPVLDPGVAATAAYALQGVMQHGTGVGGNPNDGTQVMGKTGTNEANQSWLIQSSTAVTTSFWSGVVQGETLPGSSQPNPAANVMKLRSPGGGSVWNARGAISKPVQRLADQLYPGAKFPAPAANLMKPTQVALPNVVGMTQDQATQTLQNAGFTVQVGAPVPSNLPTNQVAAQSPGPGQTASGTTVTISMSTGTAASTIPADLIGKKLQDAVSELKQAGFNNVNPQCQTFPGGKNTVMASDPPPGSSADPNTTVTLTYVSDKCGGGGNG
ncbi:transglycosylase domain-containing protein [Microbacterium sp. ASV49]|uniref:Transglycosylase domain-containing protein n=1 Tax=Microbacterium candidum TaxID=3041922 RepID=A0ABT7N2S4_9MICO|nr:transglycosylase domain-containing protein [Microbacterium sp. ASV49]MDL9981021.1 transglycosylase domain-containing protein [Microbacterium sp. ASV49]